MDTHFTSRKRKRRTNEKPSLTLPARSWFAASTPAPAQSRGSAGETPTAMPVPPAIGIAAQAMRFLGVDERFHAVALRRRPGRFRELMAARVFQFRQRRQIRLATATRQIIIFRPAHGTTHWTPQIRISKSEIRNKFKIQKNQKQMHFLLSILFRISRFGFRIFLKHLPGSTRYRSIRCTPLSRLPIADR